jgi:hypothetical protein
MRAQANAFRRVRHAGEIALERIDVDDERRRLDDFDRIARAGGNSLHC